MLGNYYMFAFLYHYSKLDVSICNFSVADLGGLGDHAPGPVKIKRWPHIFRVSCPPYPSVGSATASVNEYNF